MIISLSIYHAVYDFLQEIDPLLSEKFADSADGAYDYILEELNIRKRGEVQVDPSIFEGKENSFHQLALENLKEWDGEEYISHIDQKVMDTYQLAADFFEQLESKKDTGS